MAHPRDCREPPTRRADERTASEIPEGAVADASERERRSVARRVASDLLRVKRVRASPSQRALLREATVAVFLAATGLVATGLATTSCATNEDPRELTASKKRDGGPEGTTPNGAAAALPEGAFDYAAGVALLPFDVRLAKVARVAGLPIDDPALAQLRARRFELGDHDFSIGVRPDSSWSVSRIGAWVKALKPVCASPVMRHRYPSLPQNLDAFVLAAYGREATNDDRAAMTEAVSALDAESKHELVCLAVLSSLEFVSR